MENKNNKCGWFKEAIGKECDIIYAIFDTIDSLIVVSDKDGKIVYSNKKCEEKTGYEFSGVKGKYFWDIFSAPEKIKTAKAIFNNLKPENFPIKSENYLIGKSGDKIIISWTGTFLADENNAVDFVILTGRDVTEAGKMEAQLTEAKERYLDLIESTPLCVKVFDENGKLIFLNKGGREEHFIKDSDDISKWDWLKTVKPQYQTEAKEKFKRAFSLGEVSRIEFEHIPEGSSHEWCSSLISPVKDKDGKVKSVLFLSDDITDLKRAELEARKNEEMFRTLLNATPLCIKWFDKNGKLISINKGGREEHFLEDLSEEEIKNWNYMGCIDESYRKDVANRMNLALKGEASNFKMKHVKGTSTGEWCDSTLMPVKNSKNEVEYVLFLSRDITQEKEIENERKMNLERTQKTKVVLANILEDVKESEINLRKERDRSRAIISSMGESLLVVDRNYRIILINKAAARSIGLPEKSIVGDDIRNVVSIIRGDQAIPGEERTLEKVLKGQGVSFADLKDDFYYKFSSGRKFPVAFISTPLVDNGEIIGAVLVFRDITDQKNLDESKSNFISIASHQLRTPLTSLRWASEMLIGGDVGPLEIEQKHFVEKIYDTTDRMIELVNLLLQIARVEAGRVKVEPTMINLEDFTNEVLASLKVNLDQKYQKVEIDIEPRPFPLIPLDKEIVWQVVQNLISNAMRYSPEKSSILVSVAEKDGYVEYSVKDSGIGIPADQKGRIFEKFFRAQNALKAVPEGSGLGLSLVKYLVEDWGGKIWFESEEGIGTTFFFTIPVEGMKPRKGDVKLSV